MVVVGISIVPGIHAKMTDTRLIKSWFVTTPPVTIARQLPTYSVLKGISSIGLIQSGATVTCLVAHGSVFCKYDRILGYRPYTLRVGYIDGALFIRRNKDVGIRQARSPHLGIRPYHGYPVEATPIPFYCVF